MTGRTTSPRRPARRPAPARPAVRRTAVRRTAVRRPPARRTGARRKGRSGGPTGLHALAIAVALAVVAVVLLSLPSQESTALPRAKAAPHALAVGADASWPNCRLAAAAHAMTRPAFAIVGVNDGEPGTLSGCLARTMAWAA